MGRIPAVRAVGSHRRHVAKGHLETDFLAEADTEEDARAVVGAHSLAEVRGVLHALIAARAGGTPTRRWFDVMRDESDSNETT